MSIPRKTFLEMQDRAEAAEKSLAAIVLERSQAMKELAEHHDEAVAERDDLRAKLDAAYLQENHLRKYPMLLEAAEAKLAAEVAYSKGSDEDRLELAAKLAACGDWFAVKQDQDRRITNLEAELAAAKSRLMEVCATLDCTESECGELLAKLAQCEKDWDEEVTDAEAKLAAAEAKIREMEGWIADQRAHEH